MYNKWETKEYLTQEFEGEGREIHENSVVNHILNLRGIRSTDEVKYSINKILSPFLLKDMDKGVAVLMEHIRDQKNILIIGDYDCDGATATTIGVEGLQMLGAQNVSFLIPDRKKHGYGLTPAIVEIAGKSKPDLIVTVDNGISSIEGAKAIYALEHPCKLLITDHHLAPDGDLPPAEAIINPNQNDCDFPSKNLAGCGVMFYTIAALRTRMREAGMFEELGIEEPKLTPLLDVLALGTIADVVKLDYNNRLIVDAGLKMINSGEVRPGIRYLLESAKKKIGDIVASDFGFGAGPRLNAAGRLEDMTIGIQCLLSKNDDEAKEIAYYLNDLNVKRRDIEKVTVNKAVEALLKDMDSGLGDAYGLVIHIPEAHEGVIGIVASRIKDRHNKAVIVFADHENGTDIKGSSRSIPGVHLKHCLNEVEAMHPGILTDDKGNPRFGGHAMAAGLTVRKSDLDTFKKSFDIIIRKYLTADMVRGNVVSDMKLHASEMTMETCEAIKSAGPWGQGFEEPTFYGEFEVIDKRPVGDGTHLKLDLKDRESGQRFSAIAFSAVQDDELPCDTFIQCQYKLDINEFRGRRTVQLMVNSLQDPHLCLEMEKAQEALLEAKQAKSTDVAKEDVDLLDQAEVKAENAVQKKSVPEKVKTAPVKTKNSGYEVSGNAPF